MTSPSSFPSALIAVALILGWLVLRESSEVEDEAKQAAESYTDVEHVEVQGGLLGMDQHTPPPAPAILSNLKPFKFFLK